MLNRRGFLRNLLGVGAAMTCTSAFASDQHNERSQRTIHNLDRPGTFDVTHYLHGTTGEISLIAKVLKVDSYAFEYTLANGAYGSSRGVNLELRIHCLGLDSWRQVFKLRLCCFPENETIRDDYLQRLAVDNIVCIRGAFVVDMEEDAEYPVTLHVGTCTPVEASLTEILMQDYFDRDASEI